MILELGRGAVYEVAVIEDNAGTGMYFLLKCGYSQP